MASSQEERTDSNEESQSQPNEDFDMSLVSASLPSQTQNENESQEENILRQRMFRQKCTNIPLFYKGYFYKLNFNLSNHECGSIAAHCRFCEDEKLLRGSLQSRGNFISHLKVEFQ